MLVTFLNLTRLHRGPDSILNLTRLHRGPDSILNLTRLYRGPDSSYTVVLEKYIIAILAYLRVELSFVCKISLSVIGKTRTKSVDKTSHSKTKIA